MRYRPCQMTTHIVMRDKMRKPTCFLEYHYCDFVSIPRVAELFLTLCKHYNTYFPFFMSPLKCFWWHGFQAYCKQEQSNNVFVAIVNNQDGSHQTKIYHKLAELLHSRCQKKEFLAKRGRLLYIWLGVPCGSLKKYRWHPDEVQNPFSGQNEVHLCLEACS
jgi:hypothetical protein